MHNTGYSKKLLLTYFTICVIPYLENKERSIAACGGYAYVIATYEPTIPATYEVVLAWDSYPNIIVDRNLLHGGDPVYTPPQ